MHRFACKLDNWIWAHNAWWQAGRKEKKREERGKVGQRKPEEHAREVDLLKETGEVKDLCACSHTQEGMQIHPQASADAGIVNTQVKTHTLIDRKTYRCITNIQYNENALEAYHLIMLCQVTQKLCCTNS